MKDLMKDLSTNQLMQAAGTLWQRRGKQPLKPLRSPMVVRHRLLGRFRTSPHPEPSHSHPGAANLSESHASVADLLGRHVRGTLPQHSMFLAGLISLAVPDVPTLRHPRYPIGEPIVHAVASPVLCAMSSLLSCFPSRQCCAAGWT